MSTITAQIHYLPEGKSFVKEQPSMEKPIYRHGSVPYDRELIAYNAHIESLREIPYPTCTTEEDGRVGEFRLQWQVLNPVPDDGHLEWCDCDENEYNELKNCQGGTVTRIVVMSWRRYRFETKSVDDYRPLIFNEKYPWWCSGHSVNNDFECETAVIVAYLPLSEDLKKYWDDAFNIEYTDHSDIKFSGRFPKPEYFKN